MRYLITFSYDGSKFFGYQKQPHKTTVQGEIERALKQINGGKLINIYASGRTDAKVHAYNQKAHFDLDLKITPQKLQKALNSIVLDDIYIKKVEEVKSDFHARFNVKVKEYIYKINMGEYDPISRNYVYQHNKRMDVVEIERALKYLEGTHDFKSFSKTDNDKDDYVRTIVQAKLIRDMKNVDNITISLLGTGFHRYMVRNIVGVLLDIGDGKLKSRDIIEIIEQKDRTKARKTAHPEGLYLKDVLY